MSCIEGKYDMDVWKSASTRSGRSYSPYELVVVRPTDVDIAPLMESAYARHDTLGARLGTRDSEEKPPLNLDDLSDLSDLSDLDDPDEPDSLRNSTPPLPPPTSLRSPPRKKTKVSSVSDQPSTCSSGHKSTRKASRNKARRSKVRDLDKTKGFIREGHSPAPEGLSRHLSRLTEVNTTLDKDVQSSVSRGAYVSSSAGASERKVACLEELLAEGYRYEKWDGRETKVFTDSVTSKIAVIAVGAPLDDPDYIETTRAAKERIIRAGEGTQFSPKHFKTRRPRKTATLNMGISHGQGALAPHYLKQSKSHEDMLRNLREDPSIRRLAHFASASFAMFAPRLFNYYHEMTNSLLNHTGLQRNFPRSVWTASAVNFGPQVVTYGHRDCMNCPFGLCAIQALGDFDHTKGGHFVLHELKLVLEFPAGALLLVPSAIIKHGNTPLQPGESRVSFTQFTAGELFRYVENGFCTDKELKQKDPEGWKRQEKERERRWEFGLSLWSTVDELREQASPSPT
ncbi:hypothetical protein CC2G_008288 [Coprinopsis cinerea AmutBmut pab1-1]|nr:hypothetical protein CC2G_008288 [Coprinopsis cinerea AmutBmut pab1-1]